MGCLCPNWLLAACSTAGICPWQAITWTRRKLQRFLIRIHSVLADASLLLTTHALPSSEALSHANSATLQRYFRVIDDEFAKLGIETFFLVQHCRSAA
jgi:hypothetical protein